MRALAELGTRPKTVIGKWKESLQGRTLVVPDQNGEKTVVRGVTTLRRSIIGPRLRTIVEPSDYGSIGDLAFAEAGSALEHVVKDMGRERKLRRIKEISIPAFNTIATGFVIEQTGVHGKNPEGTIIYSNTAPRGGDHSGDIEWHAHNDHKEHNGQGFVFGILKSGVTFHAVRAGHSLSFVKDDLVGLWNVNVPANGTQFRSRDTFPDSLRILGGRRGISYFGDWIDPQSIPDRPGVILDEADGTFALPVGYQDGYGNLKTAIRASDIPSELGDYLKTTEELWIRITDRETGAIKKLPVKNRLAGAEPKTGDLFITVGSSGPKNNGYIELNEFFGNAARRIGIGDITDKTAIVFELPKEEKGPEQYSIRQLQPADTIAAAELDARWFEHSVAAEGIDTQRSIGIFSPDGTLKGFTTYEVLEGGTLPTEYTGNTDYQGKVLFVQQFTTDTNYQIGNTQSDTKLLAAIEEKARELGCNEVWEALAKEHPYRKEIRNEFDAYGFYTSHHYRIDETASLNWQPTSEVTVPCNLFRKTIR